MDIGVTMPKVGSHAYGGVYSSERLTLACGFEGRLVLHFITQASPDFFKNKTYTPCRVHDPLHTLRQTLL